MAVIHGGTDAGPPPRIDLSTNANPYGPSPFALAAMGTSVATYPDPTYTRTRELIAAHTGFPVDEIVVGAGATELIYRLVFCANGPVAAPFPGFGEYAGAAELYRRPFQLLPSHPMFADYVFPEDGIAFVTNPGSPDGIVRTWDWVHALQDQADRKRTWLVWDLAYHQLVTPTLDQAEYAVQPADYPGAAILLFAPNKAHGCTGLRAGWVRAPAPIAARLCEAQMSWILSSPGAAFLEAQASQAGDEWVEHHNLRMQKTALILEDRLARHGWQVMKGHTAWVLVNLYQPGAGERLRHAHGIKVRDLTSQGMDGWVRIGTPQHHDLTSVIDAFAAITH